MAFSYFVAICKHYPYRKIEEYANYRTYNFAFRQLFRPFIRKALKYFMNNLYMKKKVEYLVLMLTKLFKFKAFEKIYLCNPFYEDDNQRAFKIIIMKILSTLIKPHLKQAFVNFRNVAKELEKIDKKNDKANKKNLELKNDINIKKEVHKKLDKNFLDEHSYSLEEKSSPNKKADVSMKMYTFMYCSSSEESSLKFESNSEDNDRLHQLREKLRSSYGDPDDFFGFNNDGIRLQDNSLELENYFTRKKRINLSSSDSSNRKSNSNTNSNRKNIYKKNLKDEGNNTDKYEDKDKKEKEKEKEKKNSPLEEKKRNIKIDIDDIQMIKPENKRKHSNSENDISAENDNNMNIDWEYNISNDIKKKEKKEEDKKENKESKKSDDEYGTFEDISLEEGEKDNSKINKKEDKKEEQKKEKENFLISNDNKQDKSRNFKQDTKIKKNSNEIKENNKIEQIKDSEKIEENDNIKPKKQKHNLKDIINSIKDINKLSDELTNEIIKDILLKEIESSKKKLLPSKKFKFDKFDKMNTTNKLSNSLTNSFGSFSEMRSSSSNLSKEFGLNQIFFHEDLLTLNDSLMSNYSAFSVFNKTIKDKKKEHSLKLYLNKIAPKLIKIVYKEIIDKYPLIYKNISQPLKNNSDKFMISLALKNHEMLKDNFKSLVKEKNKK